jgi:hypothetical protein
MSYVYVALCDSLSKRAEGVKITVGQYNVYPGVQRFSVVRVLGGDEAEKTSGRDLTGRDLSNFISMT